MPPGGTTGQVLTKRTNADNDSNWQTPAAGGGGLTLPLTQDLTFSPDQAWNIGAPTASRPYQIYVGSTLWIGDGSNVMQIAPDTLGAPYGLRISTGGGYDLQLFPASPGRVLWSQNLLPQSTNVSDIGSATYRVRDLYVGGAVDATLIRPSATDTLEVRNGLNAETLRIYSGYTDLTNWERLAFNTSTSDSILTEQSGSGSPRTLMIGTTGASPLIFRTSDTNRWRVDATGNFTADVDNTVDIGASGATRPRNVYAGTTVYTPSVDSTTTSLIVGPTTGSSTLSFRVSNVSQWWINTTGYFLAVTTNTVDIGQSASGKPRNLFVAGAVATGIKAGAPVDADVNTPTDGMLRVDTTGNALYYRSGATWRQTASAPVANAALGTDTARLNLLTNGGFEIWQRGNGPFTTTNTYTADRWLMTLAAGDTLSVSRDTGSSDLSSVADAVCTYTRSTGGSNLAQFVGNDGPGNFRGRTVTLSVRVRTSTASAVRLRMNDGVSDLQNSAYHSGGGAYETLTLTYAVSTAPTTLNPGIQFDQSCTAYIDNAMLVVGSVAADYAPLHPADDLARCLRYYELLTGGVSQMYLATSQAGSTVAAFAPLLFRIPKAVTPTFTFSAFSDFSLYGANTVALPVTGITPAGISVIGCNSTISVASGLVAGNASVFLAANANARISVEANP